MLHSLPTPLGLTLYGLTMHMKCGMLDHDGDREGFWLCMDISNMKIQVMSRGKYFWALIAFKQFIFVIMQVSIQGRSVFK